MERSREIELIEKGLKAEIEKINLKIVRGEKILLGRKNKKQDKSPLTTEEIGKRLNKLKLESKKLEEEKDDFYFEVM